MVDCVISWVNARLGWESHWAGSAVTNKHCQAPARGRGSLDSGSFCFTFCLLLRTIWHPNNPWFVLRVAFCDLAMFLLLHGAWTGLKCQNSRKDNLTFSGTSILSGLDWPIRSTQCIFWLLALLIAAQPSQQKPNEASWKGWKCQKVDVNFLLFEYKDFKYKILK